MRRLLLHVKGNGPMVTGLSGERAGKTFALIWFCVLSVCAWPQKVFHEQLAELPSGDPWRTVYLIGDVGEPPEHQSGLHAMVPLLKDDPNAYVVFLGDNIYPDGLHKKKSKKRATNEERIVAQMDAVKNHPGRVLFIPGNHDWDQGGSHGLKRVKRQQKFVEKYLDKDRAFMPDNGCPGPEIIELGDLTMIVIDTQWWLHNHKKSIGEADGCQVLDVAQFMAAFREALKKHRNRHVLVVGHHPIRSNGEHGGKFPLKDHLFPLTQINENAYVPLPVIGSIYPLYRSLMGDRQDIQHPVNTEMVNALLGAMAEYDNVIYANGHEHSLQYFFERSVHLVTSGSGSKSTHVGNSKRLLFGAERKGFARLSFYDSGAAWLEFFGTDASGKAETLFAKEIYSKQVIHLGDDELSDKPDYAGLMATVAGDSSYRAGGIQRMLMGSLNRELWTRPIEVPYLDIHKEKGGLSPVKVGGGMQSKSIRLKGGDGNQYVVRQIKKNTTFLVAKNMRNTLAQDLIYDGIAGSHPYASIVIGALSDPVQVYHTNPELVFLPSDPVLGDVQDEFGDSFCLFEERPNKDMSHMASVGNSKNVVGYGDLVEAVHGKKKHRVDEPWTLRSRLFDMVIGDWDRHDDQWRWASFKLEDGHTVYRPIPRDRDQAFFKFDGLLPNITNRKWMMRKFQNYGPNIRDIRGQNFNARHFDRTWLTQMDREDWLEQARSIQQNLSDEDIDKAIELFPDTAKAFNGEFLKQSLKARRDNLTEIAERYYKVLARSVKVVGKLDRDHFKVERMEDGSVKVRVAPLKNGKADKEHIYFERTFYPSETKEILLYGLDGQDEYRISGTSKKKSILVRIIGGEEKDNVKDVSHAPGLGKKTKYYDDEDKDKVKDEGELRRITRQGNSAIQYDRTDFVYNTYMPLPYIGFNPDDGIYLGGGVTWTRFGFDKQPFKSKQLARGNYAFRSNSFNLEYEGQFIRALGPLDLGLEAKANFPFVFQYNGAGNETEEIPLADGRVRFDRVQVRPSLGISNKSGSSGLKLVFHADSWELEQEDDDLALPVTDDTFIGVGLEYNYENVDNRVVPNRGVRFMASVDHSFGIEDPLTDSLFFDVTHPAFAASTDIEFTKIKSELSLFFPLGWMPTKTTLALRGGVKHNEGDFNFYQASFIGGQQEFRGVRRNRYAGTTAQYNNAELRLDLREFKNHTLPFHLGIMGHYDLARVWLEGEDSNTWHSSVGGGLYFNILQFLTLNATYSVSDNGEALLVRGGLLF